MKKNLITITLSLMVSSFAMGQGVEQFFYGARFGIGQSEFAKMDFSGDYKSQTGKLALTGGISAGYYFTENFGLGLDALAVSKGSKVQGSITTGTFSQTYKFDETFNIVNIEIPFLLKVRMGKENFHAIIFGGPSQNFNLIGVSSRTYDDSGYNNNNGYSGQNISGMKVAENSLVYGIGIEISNENDQIFFLDFRKSNGLSSFSTKSSLGFNNYYTLGIGYSY